MKRTSRPVVLCFAGNDPCGGAGISADIETIVSHGCRAAPVITCLTVQNSVDVHSVHPVDADLLTRQAHAVLDDMPIAAIKIGLLGHAESIAAVAELLARNPRIPVICDPVLASGGSGRDLGTDLASAIAELILPRTTIATPNLPELERLAPDHDDLEAAAGGLLARGCELVLVTGEHAGTGPVRNRLFSHGEAVEQYVWERLADSYHGSGCTLAAAIAALLALGTEPRAAVHEAQAYTWQTLAHAERPGHGQALPHRLYWTSEEDATDA